ncbi:MAG: hypothetical protein JWP87_206 [Labilithrix sp.]|nr:hypothetical protein [Labilithrix sp.]
MPKQTVFAYVQGTDLDGVVAAIETRLDALVEERKWVLADVWVVNQREDSGWDLGLNLTLPAGKARPKTWGEDIAAIATAFGALHRETKRTFVIGVADAKGNTKDLFTIDSGSPDLKKLATALEAVA